MQIIICENNAKSDLGRTLTDINIETMSFLNTKHDNETTFN